jgi:uncharacterized protein (TIGR00269 family)
VPRHNANFCAEHFLDHCREQVRKTISHFSMFGHTERVLVAVSGGKDSLMLWDVLVDLGYDVEGLYLGLGIGEYSDESGVYARDFASARGLKLHEVDLREQYGFDVPGAAKATKRVPCSACGMSKRHEFDRAALEGGFTAVATGHNLDDEAAVLFGNVLHWDAEYLGRQLPVLPERAGFPRKVKPLVRLAERETAAWCVLRRIDYQVEECPMAEGNRHIGYKEALNLIEARSPGTKAHFYSKFVDSIAERFDQTAAKDALNECTECGAPTPGDVCAFCRLVEKATRVRIR